MAEAALRLVEKDMEKNKALDAAVAQLERAFGKRSIMRMGSKGTDEQIEVIPSGSLGLDLALGIGGLPRGRIVEIYGPERSGKTPLALHAIAAARRDLRVRRCRTRAGSHLCAQVGGGC